jgi:hypothetical protein
MHRLPIATALLTLTLGGARAAQIALYDDPAWVSSASANSIKALLLDRGDSVSTFSGLSGATFSPALAGADLVLFPELTNYAEAAGYWDSAALLALSAFVSGGGGLIAAGDYGLRVLNTVFFPGCNGTTVPCYASTGSGGPSLIDGNVALGTAYAGGPTTLTAPPDPLGAINAYAFFPANGLNLYRDQSGGTTVLAAPFGAGRYGFLAWGYGGSVPGGTLDGGWAPLMGIMVNDVAAPEPATALLLAGVLPLLAARRGRAR